jgi:hypothetical protein
MYTNSETHNNNMLLYANFVGWFVFAAAMITTLSFQYNLHDLRTIIIIFVFISVIRYFNTVLICNFQRLQNSRMNLVILLGELWAMSGMSLSFYLMEKMSISKTLIFSWLGLYCLMMAINVLELHKKINGNVTHTNYTRV